MSDPEEESFKAAHRERVRGLDRKALEYELVVRLVEFRRLDRAYRELSAGTS